MAYYLIPSWCLPASDIRVGLLGLLSEPSSAVGVLFADGLPVGQVLGPVDDEHQRADKGAIDGHVGKDASSMRPIQRVSLDFGGRHVAVFREGRRSRRWCAVV